MDFLKCNQLDEYSKIKTNGIEFAILDKME